MDITAFNVKDNISLLDTLFLKDDVLYASGEIYVMNGRIDYGHKIFDGNKKYLGIISRNDFPKSKLEEIS